MTELYFYENMDIFKGLSNEQLLKIQAGFHEVEYHSGNRLFAEGENSDRLWIVTEGQVDLRFELPGRPTSQENTIFSISAGSTLGWSSFVPPFKYKLSAYCATRRCKIVQIKKDFLLNLFEKDVRLGFLMISNLTGIASTHFHRLQETATGAPSSKITIRVHMSTCGIAAGARDVMAALMEEIYASARQDIQVKSAECIGKCPSEPNVTVEIGGEEPVIYQKMTPQKIRKIFKNHILRGQIQEKYTLV